jgi:hypothetical protein
MPALLGEYLILDVDGGDACTLELLHRAEHVINANGSHWRYRVYFRSVQVGV